MATASFFRKVFSGPVRPKLYGALSLAAWAPALVFLADNTYQVMWIQGQSMYPFLNTDWHTSGHRARDTVLVNMYRPAADLHRGDVVAFYTPHSPDRMAVKRIVALEGDRVDTRAPYPFATETVPLGHVWVEGDNPEGRFSRDSNYFGPVAASLIQGKVVAGIWPRFARVRWQDWGGSPRVKVGAQKYTEAMHYQ